MAGRGVACRKDAAAHVTQDEAGPWGLRPQRRQRRRRAAVAAGGERGAPPTLGVVAGFLTSALYTTATYPVHRVKVLLQTQEANPHVLSGKVARYTSFTSCLTRLLREQGPAGLWRGATPFLLRRGPSVALSFGIKDALRGALLPRVEGRGPGAALAANALSGGLGGGLALALVYPLEFAAVRLAADLGPGVERQFGQGMGGAWLQAVRREGLLSAYRGFGVAVGSMVTYKALYFGLYDSAKPFVIRGPAGEHAATSPRGLALRAALAAATTFGAASVCYPLDVVRKRLIVDAAAAAPVYGGSVARCCAEIARREGLRGFFRFYWCDTAFRVAGGLVLVGYDALSELLTRSAPDAQRGDGASAGGAARRELPVRLLALSSGGGGGEPAQQRRWLRRPGKQPGAGVRQLTLHARLRRLPAPRERLL
ncbi:MAG: mitochondrial carrier domain-containing protein [Monoraphidium minutum]|nr:MAG: mitochondrial carrier domain-containing protein [Monoraphidium minutum]